MVRVRLWLYLLLLPFVFFGGCTSSIHLVWSLLERGWVRSVGADHEGFPVVVVDSKGNYSAAQLGDIPSETTIVLNDFDELAINRDLNRSVGNTNTYPYFRVLGKSPNGTAVALEYPTLHESKLQGWYEIKEGQVIPTEVLQYGPGFAFAVIPWTLACGLACVAIFTLIVRPKRKPRTG